jgi:hypothetical protein
MNIAYVYPHLGLGDQVICNGLVRHYADIYDRIYLFCKSRYMSNISKMYRDTQQIRLISMDDAEVHQFMQINRDNKYIIVGHTPEFFNLVDRGETFDLLFYKNLNIDISLKWDKFYYERDLETEKRVFYDLYKLKDEEEFIFIHESNERKLNKNIPTNIKKVYPDNMDLTIFDYLYIIEKAKEVHVMNSSFMNLIDCIQIKKEGLFYHEYARPGINALLKLNWTVYK